MRKLIVASTSTLYGEAYLEYLLPELKIFFSDCSEIVFIAYARPGGISEDDYTTKVLETFNKIGIAVKGLHEYADQADALRSARGIFTGGGNTFVLVKELHDRGLMSVLTDVINNGARYLGTSAGSNICGLTMQTTNDMPIVHPTSFKAMGLLPFNINAHYIEYAQSTHMGESRQTRIAEFHEFNNIPVIGLREGSWLEVHGEHIILKGTLPAKLFRKGYEPNEIAAGSDLRQLS